jgi:hypothetical protein
MDSAITEVPRLVRDLYKVVAELELLFAAKNKKFTPDGQSEEIFNGPGDCAWDVCGKRPQKNGQHPVALSTLKKLMNTQVSQAQRLPKLR